MKRSWWIALGLAWLCAVAASSPAQAEQRPIRFGATCSMDGKYAEPGTMLLKGYQLWERQVNARGGLLERPVKVSAQNDHSQEEVVRSAYTSMLRPQGVDMVLSPYGTPLTLAALEVCEENQQVLLASAASGSQIWSQGAEYVFGIYAQADRYFIGFLDLIARQGIEDVAILYENNPFNRDAAFGTKQWSAKFGLKIAAMVDFGPGQSELQNAWQEIRSVNPGALIVCTYPPAGYRLLDLIEKAGSKPEALAMTITPVHPDFASKAGPLGENVFAPSQWEPNKRIPFPGTKGFIRSFQNQFGKQPSYHAAAGYAACQILGKAIKSTESLNQARIRDFIRSLDTVTVIGRFKVDHTGKQVGHNPLTIQWQDGQKEIVYPPRLRTAAPRFDHNTGLAP